MNTKYKKDDIVIFGWTSLTRFTVVNVVENIFHNVLPMGSNNQNTKFSNRDDHQFTPIFLLLILVLISVCSCTFHIY